MGSLNYTVEAGLDHAKTTRPVSLIGNWMDMATPPTPVEANLVTPSLISATRVANIKGKGSAILVRLKYPDGAAITVAPEIKMAAKDPAGNWVFPANPQGGQVTIMTFDEVVDVLEGGFRYGQPAVFDLLGCSEVCVMVVVAIVAGNVTGAGFETKVL